MLSDLFRMRALHRKDVAVSEVVPPRPEIFDAFVLVSPVRQVWSALFLFARHRFAIVCRYDGAGSPGKRWRVQEAPQNDNSQFGDDMLKDIEVDVFALGWHKGSVLVCY